MAINFDLNRYWNAVSPEPIGEILGEVVGVALTPVATNLIGMVTDKPAQSISKTLAWFTGPMLSGAIVGVGGGYAAKRLNKGTLLAGIAEGLQVGGYAQTVAYPVQKYVVEPLMNVTKNIPAGGHGAAPAPTAVVGYPYDYMYATRTLEF